MNVINRNYKILPTFQANLFYVLFCIIASQRMTHQPGVWYGGHFTPTNPWIYPQCDAVTLLPIIQAHDANGTIIHFDQWVAYQQVARFPSVSTHSTVNHSVTFVNLVSGTHTQNIESYWGKAKRKLKNMKGCHASQLPSYLDEFLWRERFGQTKADAFKNIICDRLWENRPLRALLQNRVIGIQG